MYSCDNYIHLSMQNFVFNDGISFHDNSRRTLPGTIILPKKRKVERNLGKQHKNDTYMPMKRNV